MRLTSVSPTTTPNAQLQGASKWLAAPQYPVDANSARQAMLTISQTQFDAWADATELPHGSVYNARYSWDGVYVQCERGRWTVFVQERGCRVHDCGNFDNYTLAKRQALATEYWHGILLPTA